MGMHSIGFLTLTTTTREYSRAEEVCAWSSRDWHCTRRLHFGRLDSLLWNFFSNWFAPLTRMRWPLRLNLYIFTSSIQAGPIAAFNIEKIALFHSFIPTESMVAYISWTTRMNSVQTHLYICFREIFHWFWGNHGQASRQTLGWFCEVLSIIFSIPWMSTFAQQ